MHPRLNYTMTSLHLFFAGRMFQCARLISHFCINCFLHTSICLSLARFVSESHNKLQLCSKKTQSAHCLRMDPLYYHVYSIGPMSYWYVSLFRMNLELPLYTVNSVASCDTACARWLMPLTSRRCILFAQLIFWHAHAYSYHHDLVSLFIKHKVLPPL